MKFFINIILLSILIVFTGCENTDLIEIPLPFEEKVVVQAQLEAGDFFQGVRITKTLPVNEPFTIEKAEVKNAYAYLVINDTRVIPLHYTSEGIYLPLGSFIPDNNDKIALLGEVDGTHFYSQTSVPSAPDIISSDYNSNGNYMEATVQPQPNEVYGALWSIDGFPNFSVDDFYSIISPDKTSEHVYTRTTVLPEIYRSPAYNGRRFVRVYSFDSQFKAFFYSKNNNQPIDNYFIEGGGSIAWNVVGDKVIGLFIGLAKSN